MRLIDADELWKHKFKSASERMDLEVAYMGGWNDAIDSIVENAPTVDAELVRHGHWTDRAKSILGVPTEACSECGEWSCGYNEPYCPNCGAKMDETPNIPRHNGKSMMELERLIGEVEEDG